MTATLGWYVHHHGDGHRQRALHVAAHAPDRFVLLGTGLNGRTGQVACVDLPDDRPSDGTASVDAERPPTAASLHYAPLDHDGVRARVAAVTAWIARVRPALLVVDVSVEIAMLARLAATPVLYVRLAGDRTDPAHLVAFENAVRLIAPFAEALEDSATPDWVRAKTVYAPGLTPRPAAPRPADIDVLVVVGRGGGEPDAAQLSAAARATPDRSWVVIGHVDRPPDAPQNLIVRGWVEDVPDWIARARLVVGAAGDGVMEAVLATDAPYVCVPASRPFDEQLTKARALAREGFATLRETWPEPCDWPDLLTETLARPRRDRTGLRGVGASDTLADDLLDLAGRLAAPVARKGFE